MRSTAVVMSLLAVTLPLGAQHSLPDTIKAIPTSTALRLDGILDEADWATPPEVAQVTGSAPTAESKPQAPLVSWKEGKTTFRLGRAEVNLANNMQLRATYTDKGLSTLSDGRAFRVRRMETKLSGWVYTPQLEFELELDWAKDKPLKNAWVAYDLTRGGKHFVLTGGQFKAPFGRQELNSSGRLMFVDRSTVSNLFARGWDVGFMASGRMGLDETPDLLTWAAGVFNGNGVYNWDNADGRLMYDARVVVSPWGSVGKEEVRPMGTDKPLLSIGAGVEINDTRTYSDAGAPLLGEKYTAIGADFAFQYGRFALFGEHFDRDVTTVVRLDRSDRGTVAEVGWLLVRGRLQLGARWAQTIVRFLDINKSSRERGFVMNLFFHNHANKLVADLRWLDDRYLGLQDKQLRVQYQLWF